MGIPDDKIDIPEGQVLFCFGCGTLKRSLITGKYEPVHQPYVAQRQPEGQNAPINRNDADVQRIIRVAAEPPAGEPGLPSR